MINTVILTKEDLIKKGKEVFNNDVLEKEKDFKRLSIEPVMWMLNTDEVTTDWI